MVRGKEDTSVKLTIKRGSQEKILILNVKKSMLKVWNIRKRWYRYYDH